MGVLSVYWGVCNDASLVTFGDSSNLRYSWHNYWVGIFELTASGEISIASPAVQLYAVRDLCT